MNNQTSNPLEPTATHIPQTEQTPPQTAPSGAKQPTTDTRINLPVSIFNDGVGSTQAALLAEALKDYSESLVRYIASAYQEGDDESAASFWCDFQQVGNLQRLLTERISLLAFENYQAASPVSFDKQTSVQNLITEYRKDFLVK